MRASLSLPGTLAALVVLLACGLACADARAAVSVNPIFRSNMVLQRGMTCPVFGDGDVGSTVTVQFQNQTVSTVVGTGGKWQVNLASMNASTSPSTLTVSATGSPTVMFTGVQVGEVWLMSGQSNMGFPLSNANDSAPYIADAANHNIRLFRMTAGNGPATSTWQISDPTTADDFSAVGYWAGLELSKKLNVPVGLIQATHDGTNISEWETSNGGTGADYLAMVKAIQPFAVRGIGWYQGESNGGDAAYETKLRDMISQWRTDWNRPDVPFGIVQLPSTKWTTARLAQFNVSQTVANTFLVVTHDLPDQNQLHPPTKRPVGIRLAIGARAVVYGEAIEYSGPVRATPPTSFVIGNKVVLKWTHLGNGLSTLDGGALQTFQIAGSNGRYSSATATIVGDTVEVTSGVAAPKAVRYGFSSGANLSNNVNIPVEGGTATVTQLPGSLFELTFP
ncbi:MAG TPA: sialate O-acetylesterase [Pyrinomonadaceae bacterium]|nr:sialate O-acetylesterase [Pyrinomonadaceae bacterium]